MVSAFLFSGNLELVIRDILSRHQFITSDFIVDEFVAFLKEIRPRMPQKWLRQVRQKLEAFCKDDNIDLSKAVRDIDDTAILQLAVKQRAIIITGDKDLLGHKGNSRVAIITVGEYLELMVSE